nr:MAG TPA: hypothetical protein [Caudoviricetes sp.]
MSADGKKPLSHASRDSSPGRGSHWQAGFENTN